MAPGSKICGNTEALEAIRKLYVDEDGLSQADLATLPGDAVDFDVQALNEGRNTSGCATLDSFILERFRWFKDHDPAAQTGSNYLRFRDSYIDDRLKHESKISDLVLRTWHLPPDAAGIMLDKIFDQVLEASTLNPTRAKERNWEGIKEFFSQVSSRQKYTRAFKPTPEFVRKAIELLKGEIPDSSSASIVCNAFEILKKNLPQDAYIQALAELLDSQTNDVVFMALDGLNKLSEIVKNDSTIVAKIARACERPGVSNSLDALKTFVHCIKPTPELIAGLKIALENDKLFADVLYILSKFLDEKEFRKVCIPLLESKNSERERAVYKLLMEKESPTGNRSEALSDRKIFIIAHLDESSELRDEIKNRCYFDNEFYLLHLRNGDQKEQALAITFLLEHSSNWNKNKNEIENEIESHLPMFREIIAKGGDKAMRPASMMALVAFGTMDDWDNLIAILEFGDAKSREQVANAMVALDVNKAQQLGLDAKLQVMVSLHPLKEVRLAALKAMSKGNIPVWLDAESIAEIKEARFHGTLVLSSTLTLDGDRLQFGENTVIRFINGKIWGATGHEEKLAITVGTRRYNNVTFWYNGQLRTGASNRGSDREKSIFFRFSSEGVLLESKNGKWVNYYFRDGTPMTGSVEEWKKRFGYIPFKEIQNGGRLHFENYQESNPKVLIRLMSTLQDIPTSVLSKIRFIDTKSDPAEGLLAEARYGGTIITAGIPGPTAIAHELTHVLHLSMEVDPERNFHYSISREFPESAFSGEWKTLGLCHTDIDEPSYGFLPRYGCLTGYARSKEHDKNTLTVKISEDMAVVGENAYRTATESDFYQYPEFLQTTTDQRYRKKLDLLYKYGAISEEVYRQALFE